MRLLFDGRIMPVGREERIRGATGTTSPARKMQISPQSFVPERPIFFAKSCRKVKGNDETVLAA
jgi:hypothetical protein